MPPSPTPLPPPSRPPRPVLPGSFTVTVSDASGASTAVPVTVAAGTAETPADPVRPGRRHRRGPCLDHPHRHRAGQPAGGAQPHLHRPQPRRGTDCYRRHPGDRPSRPSRPGWPPPSTPQRPRPRRPQPWVSSITVGKNPQGVALNPVLPRVYVANQTDKTVSVIDSVTGAVISTVKVGRLGQRRRGHCRRQPRLCRAQWLQGRGHRHRHQHRHRHHHGEIPADRRRGGQPRRHAGCM